MELRPPPSPSAPRSPSGRLTLLILLGLFTLGGVSLLLCQGSAPKAASSDPEPLRQVASKLRAAGALDEAAVLYSRLLDEHPALPNRGAIAYSLGEMYLNSAQYPKALRWFYQAEGEDTPELDGEIPKKIVHCLERLGRTHAAKAALSAGVSIDTTASVQRSKEDPIIAVIAKRDIPFSELQRSLDDLPKELSEKFSGRSGQERYLRKYLADELLWNKARRLEYDKDPAIARQISSLVKQVVVAKYLEQEVSDKMQVDPADVAQFFKANEARFTDDKPEVTFSEVKPRVEQAYRMMKFQSAYAQLIEKEYATGDVKVFADRIPQ